MIEYVFFDLGNVLVHFDSTIACQNIARLTGRTWEEAHAALYGSGLEVRYERGELDDESFAEAVRQWMGVKFKTADLLYEMSAMFTPNRAIEPLLQRLQDMKISLGILSNTCAAHWNWIQRQQWPVASGWFRDAVLSYEVGAMKPESSIYAAATAAARVPADRIFFTDDREENIEGAREAGWSVSWFECGENGVDRLRRDMKNAGLDTL